MTDHDATETCKHGSHPLGCETCDEVSLAHAVGWFQGYEYAEWRALPWWRRWTTRKPRP